MPRFDREGRTLYFDRKDHPDNFGGVINDDIWYTQADGSGGWGQAVNIGSPLNNGYHNYVCGVSDDGVLTVSNRYYIDGTAAPGVSQSFFFRDQWVPPLNLDIEQLYTGGLYAEYYMSPDRRVLLLAITPVDSRGGKDLYVSFSDNQINWSKPLNLGEVINSAGHEMAPSLSPDGRTLFFSSDGHRGYGEQDIFLSRRLDESWTNWSQPENLGPAINTPLWESHFVVDPHMDYAYYATTKDFFGNADIYRLSLKPIEEEPEEEEEVPVEEAERIAESGPEAGAPPYPFEERFLLFGYIKEGSTGRYMPAELEFSRTDQPDNPVLLSTVNAQYKMKLQDELDIRVVIRAEGYESLETEIRIDDIGERAVRRQDFELFPLGWEPPPPDPFDFEKGALIRLQNVYFDVNSAVIQSESFEELDRLAHALKRQPQYAISIEGHTNGNCAKKFCDRLSRSRAKKVSEYLVDQGLPGSRVIWKGFGKERPIATNDTEEGRRQNQRVEIRVR